MATNNKQDKQAVDYFLISDAVGSLVQDVYQSASVQFPEVDCSYQLFPFIQRLDSLQPILNQAKEQGVGIISSLIDPKMQDYTEKFCQDNELFFYNLVAPVIADMERRFHSQARQKPGIRHKLNDEYYRRIEALEFAVLNDDGQHPTRFKEADIVLLGISRTSKTPLSMYLANLGYKVANLPLVPEANLPEIIYEINRDKIIGLTNDVNVLNKFRRERLRSYGIENSSLYSNDDRIQVELDYADQVYEDLQCPVINVADRSIEETATLILMFLNSEFNNADIDLA